MSESFDIAQTFEALNAEAETPWLGQVFLLPREFSLMTGGHSILVMGEVGSGKTALEIQLKEHAVQKKRLLVASWSIRLNTDLVSSEQIVDSFMLQVMDAISISFLQVLVRSPSMYTSAPSWARDFMHWFIQRYLQDKEFHISRLTEQATSDALGIVTHLLVDKPRPLFSQSAAVTSLSHLTEVIKALGFEGIWIFPASLDNQFRISPERLEKFLTDFLSTLEYFEDPAFVFKIIVSRELGQCLQKTRGVVTRRFKTYSLKWQEDELVHLTKKRVEFVLKRELASIDELCKDIAWLQWLKHYASDSPRGWLDMTRPILAAYMQKGGSLSKTEWLNVYRQSPPLLRLDIELGRVFIGYGEVPVSAIGYKLLRYLYENRDRPCTKSELYYRANRELFKEPRNKEDEGWDDPSSWEGMMDTALWRLRQAIEWDASEGSSPIYIVSERGRGQIRLENTR